MPFSTQLMFAYRPGSHLGGLHLYGSHWADKPIRAVLKSLACWPKWFLAEVAFTTPTACKHAYVDYPVKNIHIRIVHRLFVFVIHMLGSFAVQDISIYIIRDYNIY